MSGERDVDVVKMVRRLRLVAGHRPRRRPHAKLFAAETRAGFEHDNTVAALAFIRPYRTALLGSSAAYDVLFHIVEQFEDEIYDYVTGRTVEEAQ